MSVKSHPDVDQHGRIDQVPIWLPGQGVVDIREARVDRAVNKYDERLRFGRNQNDGQWCIFMKFPPSDDVWPELYPILGFGFDPPTPEEAIAKLERTDTRRHGEEILDRVNRHNRDKLSARESEIEAAKEELALGMESFLRNQGALKYSTSYSHRGREKRDVGR